MRGQLTFEVDQRAKDMAKAAALIDRARTIVARHNTGTASMRYLTWTLTEDHRYIRNVVKRTCGVLEGVPSA